MVIFLFRHAFGGTDDEGDVEDVDEMVREADDKLEEDGETVESVCSRTSLRAGRGVPIEAMMNGSFLKMSKKR